MLNKKHKTTKFEFKTSLQNFSFLDTMVFKDKENNF